MPKLSEIFDKRNILLYQNESLDLDHYYQEPYQDKMMKSKKWASPSKQMSQKRSELWIWLTKIGLTLDSVISWMGPAVHTKSAIWFWRERKFIP